MSDQIETKLVFNADTKFAVSEIERLNKMVDKMEKESKETVKAMKDLEKTVKKTGSSNKEVADSFKSANNALGSFSKSLKGLVAGYLGVEAAMKGIDFAEQAADAQQAADAFNRLFEEMGKNAEEEFQKIKDASMGLIPDAALKQATVTAASLGVPIEKIAELMEVAVVKSREMGTSATKAFEDLATGIGRGSPMILDNLGLTIKLGDANEKMAKKLHKTVGELTSQEKTMALTNAVIEAGADAVNRYADAGLSAKQKMEKFDAQLENLKIQIGNALLPALLDAEEAVTQWIESIDAKDIEAFKNGIDGLVTTMGTVLDIVKKLNDIGMPDIIGGKDSGLFDTVVSGWEMLIDRYGFAFTATEKINDAMSKTTQILKDNKAANEESVASIAKKNEKISDQIKTLKKLQDKISQYSGWSGYEEAIEKVDGAMQQLIVAQEGNVDLMEKLKKQGDPYAEVTKGALRAAEAAAKYSDETVKALETENKKRISSAERTVKSLEKKEENLAHAIQRINQDLVDSLRKIDEDRAASVEGIENKIRDILRQGMGEYDRNIDLMLQKEEEYHKAKQALADGDLEAYKRYISKYESLVDELVKKHVDVSTGKLALDEDVRKSQVAALKEMEALEIAYYDKKKQMAQQEHDALLAQKKAELDAVKANLQAQKSLIEASRQLAEALKGQKIDIDTSAIDTAIVKIQTIQREMGVTDGVIMGIKVDDSGVDAAKENIEELNKLTMDGHTVVVDADTTPADFGIKKFIEIVDNEGVTIVVNPNYEDAQRVIDDFRKAQSAKPAVMKIDGNNSGAIQSADSAKAHADKTEGTIQINGDNSGGISAADDVKKHADQTTGTTIIDAKTDPADTKIEGVQKKIDSTEGSATVDVKTDPADQKIEKVEQEIDEIHGTAIIDADISDAEEKIRVLKEEADSVHVTIKIDADTSEAVRSVADVRNYADNTTGMVKVYADASAANSVINSLKRTTHSTHIVHVRKVYDNAEGGYVDAYAAGGFVARAAARFDGGGRVPGYDPTDSDTVNARLTRGEYVITRRAVDYYSPSLFDALNRMKMPKFAEGGAVGGTASIDSAPQSVLNFHFNGNKFRLAGNKYDAQGVATALQQYLEEEGGL